MKLLKMQQSVAFLLVVFVVAVARANDLLLNENDFTNEAVALIDGCGSRRINICLKERALKYIEQLPSDIVVGGGLSITPIDGMKRSARYFNPTSLPSEPRAREALLDTVLIDRLVNYVSSHTFQFKLPEGTVEDLKRSFDDTDDGEEIEEGRKKKKKGMNLMMLFQLKAAAIGAIMLKTIGIVAFKALILAKIALVLASVIALKKLLEQKHHTSTYEVVASHPYEEHSGHGHFDRSFNPGDLAYKGHDDKSHF